MNKSSTIWIIAALCVTIVLTAFGVVTNRMIQKDVQHSQQIVDAHREGRIRLAMWRLDALAASIVANEDERSVFEFTNPELDKVSELNPALTVNPLYYRTPDTTKLYWNLEPSSLDNVISPQVYNDSYLVHNSVTIDQNSENTGNLDAFKKILVQQNNEVPITNGALMCQTAHVSLDNWGVSNSMTGTTLSPTTETAEEIPNQDFSYNTYALKNVNSADQLKQINTPDEQSKLTLADQDSRKKAVVRMRSGKRSQSWNNTFEQNRDKQIEEEKTIKKQEPKFSSKETISKDNLKIGTPKTEEKVFSKLKPPSAAEDILEQVSESTNEPLKPDPPLPVNSNILDLHTDEPFSTPFTPLWLNGELMLVRKVNGANKDIVQGIWLNKGIIINKLLAEINDLFPDAELLQAKQDINKLLEVKSIQGDETTMLSLPLRLVHNDLETLNVTRSEYIFGPIGLAWLGAILAIVACYYMLRNVLKMAERRASFVSSVTHELRTPLTTFRLYSDLLSSGMVTDQEKQQTYLNTLKLESERLSHLVENVLSYSQIEKGSAKAKLESITLYQLIQRIEPRLN